MELRDASDALVAFTGIASDGSYTFDGVAPGSYNVVFISPAGYWRVTNVDGYVGQAVARVPITVSSVSPTELADVGISMPKMRVQITGVTGPAPITGTMNGTFDLLYVGEFQGRHEWAYFLTPPSELSESQPAYVGFHTADLELGDVDGYLDNPWGGNDWWYYGTGFDFVSEFTIFMPWWHDYDTRCTGPVELKFLPIYPGQGSSA